MNAHYRQRTIAGGVLTASLPVVLAGLTATGCSDPKAQSLIERREAHMQQTIKILQDDEASRPQRLQYGVDDVTARSKEDPERFRVTIEGLRDMIKAEQKRWQERQPEYREAINRELKGNPQRAADTLPEMLY
jgi:rubrerythrin